MIRSRSAAGLKSTPKKVPSRATVSLLTRLAWALVVSSVYTPPPLPTPYSCPSCTRKSMPTRAVSGLWRALTAPIGEEPQVVKIDSALRLRQGRAAEEREEYGHRRGEAFVPLTAHRKNPPCCSHPYCPIGRCVLPEICSTCPITGALRHRSSQPSWISTWGGRGLDCVFR